MPSYRYLIVGGGRPPLPPENRRRRVDAARNLIREAGPFQPEDLEGRLLEMHPASGPHATSDSRSG